MTTCGWIILGIGILAITFVITTLVICRKSHCGYCEYWKQDRPRICWNDGWILDVLRTTFWFLSKLSISRVIVFLKEKRYGRRHRKVYQCVDWYVFSWVIVLIALTLFTLLMNIPATNPMATCIIIGIISYRLFDIWQSWVSQFVLGGISGQWKPRNIHRSLVLVFEGYLEIIFSFALLAFILKDNFRSINCWLQSLRYSFGNAVTLRFWNCTRNWCRLRTLYYPTYVYPPLLGCCC